MLVDGMLQVEFDPEGKASFSQTRQRVESRCYTGILSNKLLNFAIRNRECRMKTVGLWGGMSWESTAGYYKAIKL